MGCDIHSYAEIRKNKKWEMVSGAFSHSHKKNHPFETRDYGVFGFLANVRNLSEVPNIKEPTNELPDNVSKEVKEVWEDWGPDGHALSWLTLKELLDFDYDQIFWDRRVKKQRPNGGWNYAARAESGEGRHLSVREFLGESIFFERLETLKALGEPEDVRIIFWFF